MLAKIATYSWRVPNKFNAQSAEICARSDASPQKQTWRSDRSCAQNYFICMCLGTISVVLIFEANRGLTLNDQARDKGTR
jgi:hypothetical protein